MRTAFAFAIIAFCFFNIRVRAEGSKLLTPENLDKQTVRFIVQLREQGESTHITIVFEDKEKKQVPKIGAWLQLYEGKTHILAAPLSVEKISTFEFGVSVDFHIETKRLEWARVAIEHEIKDAPSGAGSYMLHPKDFVAKQKEPINKDAAKDALQTVLDFMKKKGVELRPTKNVSNYMQHMLTVGPDHTKKLIVGLSYVPPLTFLEAKRKLQDYSVPSEIHGDWVVYFYGGPGGNATPEYEAVWKKVSTTLAEFAKKHPATVTEKVEPLVLYEGFKADQALLRKHLIHKGNKGEKDTKASSPEACQAAQRIFSRVPLLFRTRQEVLDLLGDPKTISDYNDTPGDGSKSLEYIFDTGLGGMKYSLRFEKWDRERVVELQVKGQN